MQPKRAVISLSGGMDSLVTLATAIEQNYIPYALHVNYYQNTQEKELKSFHSICDYYNIKEENKLVVDVDYLKKIGGTSLINGSYHKSDNQDEIPDSYVPFRNANMLSIATAWSEIIQADAIFIGASQIDYSGYPDCRKVFFDAFEKTILYGTKRAKPVKIIAPLLNMSKKDTVCEGVRLKVPFELSWSCYYNNDYACGQCDSCKLRLKGFKEANVKDPILYKNNI